MSLDVLTFTKLRIRKKKLKCGSVNKTVTFEVKCFFYLLLGSKDKADSCLCASERLEALLPQTGQRQEELLLWRKLIPACPSPTCKTNRDAPHLLRDKKIFKKLLFLQRTFVLLWLQVLRLSRTPPVQFPLHDDGYVVVLLLQPDGVHHRGKVDVRQMYPGFFQNLSASALLPRLSVGAIKSRFYSLQEPCPSLSPPAGHSTSGLLF